MKYLKSTVLFLSIFLFGNLNILYAQKSSVKTALELSKGTKIKYVKPAKKVKIWSEGIKYNVWVDSISPDKIFTKYNTFEINKIDKIAVRFKATIITGSIIGTGGLLFTGLGTVILIDGLKRDFLDGRLILTIFGGFIDFIGITATSVGTSIFFIGKKYKKNKGWKFKAVQIE